jgi:hypothetical protein
VLKGAYRKALSKTDYLTDAAPVDKIKFLRCYIAAKETVTCDHIKAGWRNTGNWPISRRKALIHPEIQLDRANTPNRGNAGSDVDRTPTTSRQITDLATKRSPVTRIMLRKVARAFDRQAVSLISKTKEVEQLKAEVERLQSKRRKVPNPYQRFVQIGQLFSLDEDTSQTQPIEAQDQLEVEHEDVTTCVPSQRITRSGREIRRPVRYNN